MLVTSIFLIFPTMFSTLPNFSFTFILLSANAFYLDQSKILLSGKELNALPDHKTQALSKLEPLADDTFIVAQMVQFLI